MGCKCRGSLPHANLSLRPLVTSASIYMRKNNKKFAALANKDNPHIIMCATVVHFHIPRGGVERAPGCQKHHTRPATPRSSKIKKSPLSQQLPWVLEPVVQATVAWSQEPAGNKSGALLHTQPNQGSLSTSSSWLRVKRGVHCSAAIYASNWMTWAQAQHQEGYQGRLQQSCGHTLSHNLRKLHDVLNTDFNSRKRMYQYKAFCIHANPHSRDSCLCQTFTAVLKRQVWKAKLQTGNHQHVSLQLQWGTSWASPHTSELAGSEVNTTKMGTSLLCNSDLQIPVTNKAIPKK